MVSNSRPRTKLGGLPNELEEPLGELVKPRRASKLAGRPSKPARRASEGQ